MQEAKDAINSTSTTEPLKPIESMVIEDHLEMKAFLSQYRLSKDNTEAKKWYHQFVWEICRHSIGEELILYPLIKHKIPNGDEIVHKSLEHHRTLKLQISELEKLEFNSGEFSIQMQLMYDELLTHLEEEETVDLKKLVEYISLEERIEAGKKFQNRKLIAPTRPHTTVPDDDSYIESLAGFILAPIDKFKDLFSSYPLPSKIENVEKEATKNLSEYVAERLQSSS